jgi:membrane protein
VDSSTLSSSPELVARASIGLVSRRLEVTLRAAKSFSGHRGSILAGGVTYFALVSLFPLMFVALAAAGYIWSDPADQQVLIDNLLDALPLDSESGRGNLEDLIDSVVRARGAIGIVGLVGAVYTGSAMFAAVRHALNQVFEVEEPRAFWRGKLIDLALVLAFGLLLLVSVLATFSIAFITAYASDLFGDEAAKLARWGSALLYLLVPALLSTLIFLLLYSQVAHAGATWRESSAGALVAAIGFELLKVGFAEYVAAFGNYDATYGALGFLIILLLFFFLSSQLMLFGAEVVRADREYSAAPALTEITALRRRLRGIASRLRLAAPPDPIEMIEDQGATAAPPARHGTRTASASRSTGIGRGVAALYALGLVVISIAGAVRAGRRRADG